jgi:hypothetical protein
MSFFTEINQEPLIDNSIIHLSEEETSNNTATKHDFIKKKKQNKPKNECPPDFKCVTCNKQFQSKSAYYGHTACHVRQKREEGLNGNEKIFTCDICGNKYYHQASLNKHKKVNHGITRKKKDLDELDGKRIKREDLFDLPLDEEEETNKAKKNKKNYEAKIIKNFQNLKVNEQKTCLIKLLNEFMNLNNK